MDMILIKLAIIRTLSGLKWVMSSDRGTAKMEIITVVITIAKNTSERTDLASQFASDSDFAENSWKIGINAADIAPTTKSWNKVSGITKAAK